MIMRHIFTLLSFFAFSGFAQEAIPATGGEATGSGGTVSFTVGQVAYTTKTDGTTSTSEGVQQTYTIIDNSEIEESSFSLEMVTFPNPTLDKIQLHIMNLDGQNLTCNLTDIQGKTLQSNQVLIETTVLDLNNYESGTYFLKINNTKEEIKTFKIIKN
jgi:hypothetical protein